MAFARVEAVRPKAGLGIGSTGGQSTLERSQLLPERNLLFCHSHWRPCHSFSFRGASNIERRERWNFDRAGSRGGVGDGAFCSQLPPGFEHRAPSRRSLQSQLNSMCVVVSGAVRQISQIPSSMMPFFLWFTRVSNLSYDASQAKNWTLGGALFFRMKVDMRENSLLWFLVTCTGGQFGDSHVFWRLRSVWRRGRRWEWP